MVGKWLVLIGLVGSALAESDSPMVDSPAGKFAGVVAKSRNGRDIHSYLGIPYAKPPLGELRFKDPVMMPKLEGVYNAIDDSAQCYQQNLTHLNSKNLSTYIGTEDCLYLNVHVPKVDGKKDPLPVLFWIHGGGFYLGSKSNKWNGPDFLLDKDMILVTANYRLGILGFLSTKDSVIPGNMGMKDQTMAMKWVQQNIASFGGDPNAVTVAGESAGGVASSLHIHSPLSKGLFQRAISQSGTAFNPFSAKPGSVVRMDTEKIANHLGCSLESEKLLRCLQKMPKEQLFEAGFTIAPEGIPLSIDFLPTLEEPSPGAFLTKESLMEPATVPTIIGVNSGESLSMPTQLATDPNYRNNSQLIKNMPLILSTMGCYWWLPNKDDITDKIVKFYYGEKGPTGDNIIPLLNCLSDVMFNHGAHLAALKEKGPVFLYMLSYRGQKRLPYKFPEGFENAVVHGEDLLYLFNFKPFVEGTEWTKEDTEFSKKMVQLWYDFVKSGDPTPETKIWKESNKGVDYLDMTNDGFVMKSNMFKERNEFLDKLNIDRLSQ